jgi:predicted PurR-regulated permease PerM
MTTAPSQPPDPASAQRGARGEWPGSHTVVRVVFLLVALAAVLELVWLSRRVVTWLLIATILAIALNPAVVFLQRRARMPRGLAIGVVYIAGMAALAGVLLAFIPRLVDAGQELANKAPGYADRLRETSLLKDLDKRYDVLTRLEEFVTDIPKKLGGAGAAVDVVQRVLSGVFGALTVLVLTAFLLVYGSRMVGYAIAMSPASRRARLTIASGHVYRTVGGYVAGNLAVSLIAGICSYTALKIAGVPAAFLLAFFVALMDLIPLIGATIGAIGCVAVAGFQGWVPAVGLAVFFLIYQQVENHLVQPQVMRKTTDLNPFATLVAVLVGAELLGVLGALIAIPVAGVVQIVIREYLAHRGTRGGPEERSLPEETATAAP